MNENQFTDNGTSTTNMAISVNDDIKRSFTTLPIGENSNFNFDYCSSDYSINVLHYPMQITIQTLNTGGSSETANVLYVDKLNVNVSSAS
jgi:hypothetical protein